METWQVNFEWVRVQHIVKNALKRETLPDLNMVLLMVGVQELGRWKTKWSKEEKQDLMHIGVCTLLEMEGYFTFSGRDADGWPHFDQVRHMPKMSVEEQEYKLTLLSITYFKQLEDENGGWGALAES
jgi:3-oxoacyl-ACP reductase-like protein